MEHDDWRGAETLIGQFRENGHTINLYKAENGFSRARIDHTFLNTANDMAYSAKSSTLALSLAKGFCRK